MAKAYLTGTFRIDPISLAKIAVYFAQKGVSPSSRNALVSNAIDTLAHLIKDVEAPATIDAAHSYLDTHFPVASYRAGEKVIQRASEGLSITPPEEAKPSYAAYKAALKTLGLPITLSEEEWKRQNSVED